MAAGMIEVRPQRLLDIDPATHPQGRSYLAAASGLLQAGTRLYVVADDEWRLGVFDAGSAGPGRLDPLLGGELPLRKGPRKKHKPDLESLAALPSMPGYPFGALLALGSGSRPNRNRGALVAFNPDGSLRPVVRELDLSPLYGPLNERFERLNVEGATVVGAEFMLLQRGNKAQGMNASVHYAWAEFMPWLLGVASSPVPAARAVGHDLGAIRGIPLSFTDATALRGGAWAFSAVAEDTDDSYEDGACVGAAIGVVDASGTLRRLDAVQPTHKVEGIAARIDGDRAELLLVTDADDSTVPSLLLSAEIVIEGIGREQAPAR